MKNILSILKSAVGIAVLLAMVTPARLRAGECDVIDQIGDKWHAVADYIEKHSDDGKLRKSEAAKVRTTVHEISPGTSELSTTLIALKDEPRAKSLGTQLKGNLEELAALGENDNWDDVGEIVDKIGDIMNKVAEVCRSH
jgi:hypothetical protein